MTDRNEYAVILDNVEMPVWRALDLLDAYEYHPATDADVRRDLAHLRSINDHATQASFTAMFIQVLEA